MATPGGSPPPLPRSYSPPTFTLGAHNVSTNKAQGQLHGRSIFKRSCWCWKEQPKFVPSAKTTNFGTSRQQNKNKHKHGQSQTTSTGATGREETPQVCRYCHTVCTAARGLAVSWCQHWTRSISASYVASKKCQRKKENRFRKLWLTIFTQSWTSP